MSRFAAFGYPIFRNYHWAWAPIRVRVRRPFRSEIRIGTASVFVVSAHEASP